MTIVWLGIALFIARWSAIGMKATFSLPPYALSGIIIASMIGVIILVVSYTFGGYGKRRVTELQKSLEDLQIERDTYQQAVILQTQTATEKEQLATDLQAQLDAEQSKVKGLTDAQMQLTTANEKIAVLNTKIATVENELTTAQQSLTTAKQEELTAVTTVKDELATVQATVEKLQADKKRLLQEQTQLAPYLQFFEHYRKYKDAESIKNSRNSSEGEKVKATVVFNSAKADLAAFYLNHKEG